MPTVAWWLSCLPALVAGAAATAGESVGGPVTNSDEGLDALSQLRAACLGLREHSAEALASSALAADAAAGRGAGADEEWDALVTEAQSLRAACRQLFHGRLLPGALQGAMREEDPDGGLARRLFFEDATMSWAGVVGIMLVAMLVLIVVLEGACLRSSLFGSRLTKQLDKAHAELQHSSSAVLHLLTNAQPGSTDPKHKQVGLAQEKLQAWGTAECRRFRAMVQTCVDRVKTAPDTPEVESPEDRVRFERLDVAALEEKGSVDIALTRRGQLKGAVVVRVCTVQVPAPATFRAERGKDFVHTDIEVRFEEGQQRQTFQVKLLRTDACWLPTRWFYVQLTGVVSGQARVFGPHSKTAKGTDAPHPTARVFILQDDAFPANIPEKRREGEHADLWFFLYFMKDRIKARGRKFWKAMAGFCYEPVHFVAVTPLVQSYLIDFAADPRTGGYGSVIALVSVQFISTLLLRIGDFVQTTNRGRTGGVRQVAREQLLSKMLMMEHMEQHKYTGDHWFYSALVNVESMTSAGYWQVFIMVQSLLGLVLSFLVLLWKAWHNAWKGNSAFNGENLIPALWLLLLTPVCFGVILLRRRRAAELIEKRMDAEEEWVETFAWLASHVQQAYTFGLQEMSRLDMMFSGQSKFFIKQHWAARDFTNDSTWVTNWLGNIAYCGVLLWIALRLYDYRDGKSEKGVTAGDALLLIQVFDKVTRYYSKLSSSFVNIQQGAVSVRKVSKLLELPEQKSFLDELRRPPPSVEPDADHIVIQGVVFDITEDYKNGLGPVFAVRQISASPIRLPLGKIIFVVGGSESRRFTVLKLIQGAIRPTRGSITMPHGESSLLLPDEHVSLPNISVKENFMLNGASEQVAVNLSMALDIDPDTTFIRLTPGHAAAQSLARHLIRDPTILAVVRPISTVTHDLRPHVLNLITLWQLGGGVWSLTKLLSMRNNDEGGLITDELVADLVQRHDGGQSRRTLIISGEEVPDFLPPYRVHVLDIDEHFAGA